jgi:hypothetical protein
MRSKVLSFAELILILNVVFGRDKLCFSTLPSSVDTPGLFTPRQAPGLTLIIAVNLKRPEQHCAARGRQGSSKYRADLKSLRFRIAGDVRVKD